MTLPKLLFIIAISFIIVSVVSTFILDIHDANCGKGTVLSKNNRLAYIRKHIREKGKVCYSARSVDGLYVGEGVTPEEAVANLWLKIKMLWKI